MTESKKADPVKDESYLDYLGIGGDEVKGEEKKGEEEPKVADLLKTIETLSQRMDTMQEQPAIYSPVPMTVTAPVVPVAPKLREVTLDGLPDQVEHPEEWTRGLNSRIGEAVTENIRALSTYNAEVMGQEQATAGRSDQLWKDFQSQYMDKLEEGLPEGVTASSYVEVVARDVAGRAKNRGVNLDAYMYQTSAAFMRDVYDAADKVLAPLRAKKGEEGEAHPTAEEAAAAHRTEGIIGAGGLNPGKSGPEEEDKSTLISDLQEVQVKTGFF